MISFKRITAQFASPVRQNFLWMAWGNGFYAACQWGMLVILSKLGSPEVVGHFALGLAITAPVIMITNMQLRAVQATDAKQLFFLSDYVAVRLISTLAALLIIVLTLYFGRYGGLAFWATILLALAKSVESLSDVFFGFWQQHEKMSYIAKSMMIKGVLSVVVLGAVFYFTSNLILALAGLTLAWLTVFIFYDTGITLRLRSDFERPDQPGILKSALRSFQKRRGDLVRIVKIAFPLGIVMGIISFNTNIPRYAIERFSGARELGFFAALAYTTVALGMFIQALGQAVSPRLAKSFADNDINGFKRLFGKMVLTNAAVGLFGILVVILGGRSILTFIYTSEYSVYFALFIILMVFATISGIGSAFGYAMTAARQYQPQVPLFLTVLVATSVLSFLLIPRFGLYGAAAALIISALIQLGGALIIIDRALKHKLSTVAGRVGDHEFA